jgi:hypothetical protein
VRFRAPLQPLNCFNDLRVPLDAPYWEEGWAFDTIAKGAWV